MKSMTPVGVSIVVFVEVALVAMRTISPAVLVVSTVCIIVVCLLLWIRFVTSMHQVFISIAV